MKRAVGILALALVPVAALWLLARDRPARGATSRMEPALATEPEARAFGLVPAAPAREAVSAPPAPDDGETPRHATFQLDSGKTLRLDGFGPLAAEKVVPIEGLLHVPPEWELARFQVELRLLAGLDHHARLRSEVLGKEQLVELTHAPGYFALSTVGAPGKYQLLLPELAYRELFEVGPGGRVDLRFEAPLPRVVLARCFDAASGAPLTPTHASVRWFGAQREGGQINSTTEATWREELQAWRILAPRETVALTAYGAGYFDERASVPAAEGTSEVRLELAVAHELRLELREDGKLLPWNAGLHPRLVPAAGQVDHVTIGIGPTSCRLVQRAGGTYSLELDTPAGYRPIQPVLVTLDGPRTEHTIELVRLR